MFLFFDLTGEIHLRISDHQNAKDIQLGHKGTILVAFAVGSILAAKLTP